MKKKLSIILFVVGALLIYWGWNDLGVSSSPLNNGRIRSEEPMGNVLNYLKVVFGFTMMIISIILGMQNIILNSHKIAKEKNNLARRESKKKVTK